MAREHVTVALCGLGGDEVAVGYHRHIGLLLSQHYRKLPRFFREKVVTNLVNHLPDSKKGRVFTERLKRFVNGSNLELYRNYMSYMTYLTESQKKRIYSRDLYQNMNGQIDEIFNNHFNQYTNLDIINRALFADLKIDLPDNLLTLTDRMSMAQSLEVRVPFLDHKLLEFMATIPPEFKLRGFSKKFFLKKAFEDILPKDILYKRKQGFTIPLALWFRSELKDFVQATLSKDRVERIGFLNYDALSEMLEKHFRAKENYHCQIWTFMMFVLWYEANFENG